MYRIATGQKQRPDPNSDKFNRRMGEMKWYIESQEIVQIEEAGVPQCQPSVVIVLDVNVVGHCLEYVCLLGRRRVM